MTWSVETRDKGGAAGVSQGGHGKLACARRGMTIESTSLRTDVLTAATQWQGAGSPIEPPYEQLLPALLFTVWTPYPDQPAALRVLK